MLVGNAPFTVAVGAALGVAVLGTVVGRVRGTRPTAFDLGNVGVFVVLAVAAVVVPGPVLERWLQPLGNAGPPWTGGIALGGERAGQAAADRDATARVRGFLARVCAPASAPEAHRPRLHQ